MPHMVMLNLLQQAKLYLIFVSPDRDTWKSATIQNGSNYDCSSAAYKSGSFIAASIDMSVIAIAGITLQPPQMVRT